jgi:hypothetical protein
VSDPAPGLLTCIKMAVDALAMLITGRVERSS